MDILNFISWIKAGNYRTTLPTDVTNLIAVGAKDPSRDDGYLPLAVNAAPLQSLYDTANVTQLTSTTTDVTVNAHNGIITTVSSILSQGQADTFDVLNSTVTAGSKVLLSVEYAGAGTPIVSVVSITAGSFTVKVYNVDSATLDDVVKIHYIILN